MLVAACAPAPPVPAYPTDPVSAHARHAETFPALEQFAASRLRPADLTEAALQELLRRRHDGHTFLFSRAMLEHARSTSGRPDGTLGLVLTDTPPLAIADVLPHGPAQRAGLRRGQAVLTINGQPAAHLRRFEASALLDRQAGAANALRVQAVGGEPAEVELRADPLPLLSTEILPGPFGLLRFDSFGPGAELVEAVRAALTAFERARSRPWGGPHWSASGPPDSAAGCAPSTWPRAGASRWRTSRLSSGRRSGR